MVPTSSNYKKFVYNKAPYELDARHFLPQALIKIIDVAARDVCSYAASSTAFYNEFADLIDDNTAHARAWGTLEDFQFLLNGTIQLMPDSVVDIQAQQNGFVSEEMSDAQGNINVTLTCSYTQQVSTVGRTLFFDPSYDAVPSDFTIVYYRTGTEIARDTVSGNTAYMYTSKVAASRYDQMIITFTKTTHPYRRIHLTEDIPGVYAIYADKDIVSLNITQSVDIFSEELTVGEIDLTIQNITKQLDILNAEGLERYLQRRQPIEIRLNLVFPDDSVESILVAYWELSTWKSNKGALDATFTIRDPIDKLTAGEYIKGTLPSSFVSFYDLAKDVLDDAGVKEYTIDSELHNVYTKACLPIAEHKELLRMIAQATQSVVLPEADGSIHIKYISPLIYGYNMLTDGAFNKADSWTLSNASLSTDYLYIGSNSVKMGAPTSSVTQTISELTVGHIYYGRFYALPTVDLTGQAGIAGMYIDNVLTSVNIQAANLGVEEWSAISCRFTHNAESMTVKIQSTLPANILYIDGLMICDLTLIYGAGNEPTQEWCDSNIRFIADTMLIPRARDPVPVDDLDYNILIDAPEIETSEAVKSVETSIYSYEAATEVSEVYKGQRIIAGTEEFTIKFNSIAKDCTVEAVGLTTDEALPTGYTRLLYIEGDGAQYTDINFALTSKMRLEYEIAFTAFYGDDFDWFAGNMASKTNWLVGYHEGMHSAWNGSKGYVHKGSLVANTRVTHVLDVKNQKFIANGDEVAITLTNIATGNIRLFIGKGSSFSKGTKCRCYAVKLYKNDALICNLVPCKNDKNVAGLYDIKNGVFYSSKSSTAFIAGDPAVTILEQAIYSRAAKLKVRANDTVQITVKGKKVTQSTSTYKVDADIEPSLVADAIAKSIDNELITYRAIAENVTSFATYWYGRRYRYDFDWRQNPAIELLDTITVHDDFDRNNGVYITDRELEYNNGVLSGNSKGVY